MHTTPLPSLPRHVRIVLLTVALLAPVSMGGSGDPLTGSEPFEQDFVITAYYSPAPGQCCYVKGGLKADKILNGEGHTAADGTGVYPGMIAAPPSYPFGTRIMLSGLGVLEVHDRGGAILERADGTHRLDIWMGEGEEGLARALTFGVRRVRGTVYPNAVTHKPQVAFSFDAVPTDFRRLDPYMPTERNFLSVRPRLGDRGPSVSWMQEYLRDAGYFRRAPTGLFGPETQESLADFIRDYHVQEPSDALMERTAAYLLAAHYRSEADDPVSAFVDQETAPGVIMEAQRILRFLGYYRGRTDGKYSDTLFHAILSFQQAHQLVGTADDPGAGRIGPITNRVLRTAWDREIVARRAQSLLDAYRVELALTERGDVLTRFLEEGESWSEVRMLQNLLAEYGLFPVDRITGYFGPETRTAVLQYQLSKGLIVRVDDAGAGRVGPATLQHLRSERVKEFYRLVRAEGWRVL